MGIQDSMNAFAGTEGLSIQDAAARLASLPKPGQVDDDDGVLETGVDKDNPTDYERLTDPDFDNWNGFLVPEDWEVAYPGEAGEDLTKTYQTTDSNTGNYAVASEIYVPFGDYIGNVLFPATEFTKNQTIDTSLYVKKTSGDGVMKVSYSYETEVGEGDWEEYYYNFTGVNAGTWTLGEEGPSSDNFYICNAGDNVYSKTTIPQVTAPDVDFDDGYVMFVPYSANNGDVVLVDDISVLVDSVETVENASFETWITAVDEDAPLDDWTYVQGQRYQINESDDYDLYFDQSSTVYDTAPYSGHFYVGKHNSGQDNRQYIYASYAGTAGQAITPKVKIRTSSDEAKLYVLLLDNADPASHTQAWNGTAWGNTTGDIKSYVGGSYVSEVYNTGSFLEVEIEDVTIPASGTITLVVMARASAGGTPEDENYEMWVDTCSLEQTGVADDVTYFNYEIPEGELEKEIGADDRIFSYNDGETEVFGMNGDLEFVTDEEGFDFTDKPILVATEVTNELGAVNLTLLNTEIETGTIKLLATKTGIDLVSVSDQTLSYTVPTGYKLIIDTIKLEATTVTNYSDNMSLNIHLKSTSTVDINLASYAPTTLNYIQDYKYLIFNGATGANVVVPAGETLSIDVRGAVTADALVCTAYLYGTLIAI